MSEILVLHFWNQSFESTLEKEKKCLVCMCTRIMDIIINWLFFKHDDASICSSAVFLITWCSVQSWFPLLCLSSQCLMIVVWLFLTVPRVCLQVVIVVFPVHTHYFQSRTRDWPIWKAVVTSLMSTGLLFADNWVLYIHFMTVLPCKKNSLA